MNIILFSEKPSLIPLEDERAKHILSVLRLKVGDSFKAGIINSSALKCKIDCIDDKGIHVTSEEGEDLSELYPITLLLAEVRPISMRRIFREAVSLGVGKIMLVISDLGEKSYSDATLYKSGEYKNIMIDGAMQSGFSGLSEVSFYSSVDDALKDVKEDNRILLDNVVAKDHLSSFTLKGSSVLAIGPERGWTDRERSLMLSNGFKPALLGKRILRTETAVVSAISVALTRIEDK